MKMERRGTRNLVETYITGWKENDVGKILGPLAPDCVVIESHGPTFRGIDAIQSWVENWISEGSRVDRWDITSFHSFEDAAAFEWDFKCTTKGQCYHIEGISIVELEGEKISALREYRRTEFPYAG